MAYRELIKSFENVRAYMREFYVYGFKSRTEYDAKSARSYDDARRRIESWLGDYMHSGRTSDGKNVFLSVDGRVTKSNPFYKAWKTKSFTDGDITLHFILMDILCSPKIKKTLTELVGEIDDYLSGFEEPMTFDESTVRKKLKEYAKEGLVQIEKDGRKVFYSRMPDTDIANLRDVINFFSEVAPCGVVGSYLQDRFEDNQNIFAFKHRYFTQAMDSEILAQLFEAIHEKRFITADIRSGHSNVTTALRLAPLKIYISTEGQQHLIAFHEKSEQLNFYRLDYMANIRMGEICPKFDDLRIELEKSEKYMWAVSCKRSLSAEGFNTEHVEFDVRIEDNERDVIRRLEREKRCGNIEKLDEHHYRYSADVFDTNEMLPWIRTFISGITRISFSNRAAENKFKSDLREMYRMYGIGGGTEE